MTRPTAPREFEMKIDIAAPRAAVWKAIATDTGLRRWFPPEAKVSPGVGGEVLWRWNEHFSWPQQIEIWEPESRLRTRYDSSVEDGEGGRRPLFVDFLLEGEGGRTTLRLVQSGFGPEAAFDHEYDGISRGWPVELRSLRLYLEQHAGKDRRLAWAKTAIRLDADEAWRRLTGDDGLACGASIDELSEGDSFRIRTAAGDVLEGDALQCHRREFTGRVRNHGDGFLRISADEWQGATHVWMWLATYGQPQDRVAELQARWDAMLGRLFQSQDEAAITGGA